MHSIDIWKLTHLFENDMLVAIDNNVKLSTRLLDLSKNQYSLLEKFVYDTAMFHFKRLNIDITKDECYVEFWCKNKFDTHCLHLDCDEHEKKTRLNYIYPVLSCVTYFNDNPCPTIITNIDLETYKYKEFETHTELFLSLPKSNKQITFDGKHFHGSTILKSEDDIEKRYIIAINLWDKRPSSVDYYNNSENNTEIFTKDTRFTLEHEDDGIETINVNKTVINYNLYDSILYNQSKDTCYVFNKFIQDASQTVNSKSSYLFVLDNTIEKKEFESKLKNKYGDVIDDINEVSKDVAFNVKHNRFLQRFHYSKVYTVDICRFIINECEKYAASNGGWTTKRHDNYPTTDLPVEKIVSIFGLVLESMNTISKKVHKSYCLHNNMKLNVKDLFVVKYKDNAQCHLEMHQDGSFLSFNILLSDTSDLDGGGTYFDDGLTAHLEQGDILIHSSRVKHSGLPIVKGTRYLLVGFLDIVIQDDV